MRTETLSALVIDYELGELAPEAAELFEAYLRAVPDAARLSQATADAVRNTRTAVRRFPEIAPRTVRHERRLHLLPRRMLARAAAAVLLIGGGVWIGRQTGPEIASVDRPRRPLSSAPGQIAAGDSPWAQYRVVYDPRTGAYVLAQHD